MESSAGMLPEKRRPSINAYNTSNPEQVSTSFLSDATSLNLPHPIATDDEVYVHRLRVSEAKSTDAGHNIVRIDGSSLILLGIKVGDIVVITGANGFRAAALCLDSEMLEVEPVIRMDRIMRTNLGLVLGDLLLASAIKPSPVGPDSNDTEIILDPLVPKVPSAIDEEYLARALRGMPLIAGQAIVVPYFGGMWYPFIVLKVGPIEGVNMLMRDNQPDAVAIVGPRTRLVFGASGLSV